MQAHNNIWDIRYEFYSGTLTFPLVVDGQNFYWAYANRGKVGNQKPEFNYATVDDTNFCS